MRVKVHPHRGRVNAGHPHPVSVTPDRQGGKATYFGYVYLKDVEFRIHKSGVERAQREQVRNVHAWCVGEMVVKDTAKKPDIWFQDGNWEKVTYHYNIGRFVTMDGRDVTDETFTFAACNGRDFYVRVHS